MTLLAGSGSGAGAACAAHATLTTLHQHTVATLLKLPLPFEPESSGITNRGTEQASLRRLALYKWARPRSWTEAAADAEALAAARYRVRQLLPPTVDGAQLQPCTVLLADAATAHRALISLCAVEQAAAAVFPTTSL